MEVNIDCSQKKIIKAFPIFKRRILRMVYGPINENSMWKNSYSNELYTLYDELDIAKVRKTGI